MLVVTTLSFNKDISKLKGGEFATNWCYNALSHSNSFVSFMTRGR